ncbi:hypothetical protein AWC14_10385 [Mycobacterium kyorinense]|uniref:Uncharacterized protein n=1 Tax=Mycobacterium kyorinense TaxID=487514 RepID=A0A1X1XNX0_9MYCO|nr:hypothetical protein AWC14_10385 [Mycobacterium kyorinense]
MRQTPRDGQLDHWSETGQRQGRMLVGLRGPMGGYAGQPRGAYGSGCGRMRGYLWAMNGAARSQIETLDQQIAVCLFQTRRSAL